MSEIAVSFNSVSFSYGGGEMVLKNASFHIHKGEFIAMVGPNGCGKTTVIKLLFGLVSPCAGKIEIFGKTRGRAGSSAGLNKLAYVPQHFPAEQLFPITVRDVVKMGHLHPLNKYSIKDNSVEEAMEQAGIKELGLKPYSSLSGGQKRRTLVARALAARPQLLVLDEPTANMDSESETRLYETLGAFKGKTSILIVTHDTEFVSSLTDRVLCLGDGSRSIVQHRVQPLGHSCAAGHTPVRVLHEENISAGACCDSAAVQSVR